MRTYELVVIIHPDLDDEAVNQAVDKIKYWIETVKVRSQKYRKWGITPVWHTRLKNSMKGLYYLLKLELDPASNAELEAQYPHS
jgi:ribosomal protein S6